MFPLTRNFPGLGVSAWQRLQSKAPAGYGRGQSAELGNFIKLAMVLYARLLREECSGNVVKLHGRLAETWLVACEAALLQGSVHKMEKSSAKYRSFISLLKTSLEMFFHFAFSS